MCLLVRYVDHETLCITEDFITYVDLADDLTGSGLATAILDAVVNANIPLAGIIWQGYDGSTSMSGRFKELVRA